MEGDSAHPVVPGWARAGTADGGSASAEVAFGAVGVEEVFGCPEGAQSGGSPGKLPGAAACTAIPSVVGCNPYGGSEE